MAEPGNCVRVTRSSKKRAATKTGEEQGNKKRIVLGELSNLNANSVNRNLDAGPEMTKSTVRMTKASKAKKALMPINKTIGDAVETVDNDVKSDDHQISGPKFSDIYGYLRNIEVDPNRRPLPDYIEKVQKGISASMRGILVDWLVEVAEEYKLVSDTLYLTIIYVDRFLSLHAVDKHKLQLLGVSSMLIASKYEEITPPNVEEFCYITDNSYTKEEVLKMESDILKFITLESGSPTIRTFLRRFTGIVTDNYNTLNSQLEFLGYYLAELSLLDYKLVKFLPSLVAASVLFLARFIIKPKTHPWSMALQQYTRYKPSDLKECVLIIHDLYLSRRASPLQAVREKYKQQKFKCVATTASPPEVPLKFFKEIEE